MGNDNALPSKTRSMRTKLLTLICAFLASQVFLALGAGPDPAKIDVRACGAVGDGTTSDTAAIQRAIDTCSEKGGGTVEFPAGRYVSGSIFLKDNVTLRLDAQAVLLGSTNIADYKPIEAFTDAVGIPRGHCFIGAADAKNIGIEGGGTIDGRGKELLAGRAEADKNIRPFLVRFVRCTGVSLKNIHLLASAAWTVHFFQCRDVSADGVTIFSRGLQNNDGFDIDSSENIRITNCDVDSGDDALCIKATSPLPSRNIVATGCRLKSGCGAIKIGTESLGDFENIEITNCQIRDTNLGGIKLFSVDGAHLQNVKISDITMDNVKLPVFLRLGARLKTFRPGDASRPAGILTNVTIKNIRASSPAHTGILISGIPGHRIENVTIENIELLLPGGGTAEDAKVVLPEKETAYPELGMFGPKMPAYALVARHAKGLKIKNLKVTLATPDARPAKFCEDLEGFEETGWNLPAAP